MANTALWLLTALVLLVGWPAHAGVPGGTRIGVRALAEYTPSASIRPERVQSNLVYIEVAIVEALRLSGDQFVTRPPVAMATFNYALANTGNVRTDYRLVLQDMGGTCAGAHDFPLAGATVHQDINLNGAVDDSEPAISAQSWLGVGVGTSAALLVRAPMPNLAQAQTCFTLSAESRDQGASDLVSTTVAIGSFPALQLRKTALWTPDGYQVPGQSRLHYEVLASNVGVAPAAATGSVEGLSTIRVDGMARTLVLLRDEIPEGTRYIPQSLRSTMPGALRLFRLPGDPALSFRTIEDASAIEVAIGLPQSIAVGGSAQMGFDVQLLTLPQSSLQSSVVNQARAHYGAGTRSLDVSSNLVVTPLAIDSIGVALAAAPAQPQTRADGTPDGTATVQMVARVRNYRDTPLYDVQLTQLLEGAGTYRLGDHVTGNVPAANQYTVVPGSLRVLQRTGSLTRGDVAPAFNGTPSGSLLLAPGARLGPQGELVVQFVVRVNFVGRGATLFTKANASAARVPGAKAEVTDESVNGDDPDPTGLGPTSSTSWTPVSAPPLLSISKQVGMPRRLGGGQYELDYQITVGNSGAVSASGVRVVDNLACALGVAGVRTWSMVQAPVTSSGRLDVSPSFTGRPATAGNPCLAPVDPATQVPTDNSLSLTDGLRPLAPGESETVRFTVRVELDTAGNGGVARAEINNQAWAAAVSGERGRSTLVAAKAALSRSLLIDPQGIVYDSSTRQPMAGAVVTVRRLSCLSGTAAPIAPADIFDPDQYQFNADGTVSLTTTADGTYQFFWRSPPVTQLCTYELSVKPPLGFVSPSTALPARTEVFEQCGAVVPANAPPALGESATYFTRFLSGRAGSNGAICEMVHNHVPLDPVSAGSLVMLKKEAAVRTAEIGDFVDYTLTLSNNSGVATTGFRVTDQLPPGFAYVVGSARLNGVRMADPAGSPGPTLVFADAAAVIDSAAQAKVSYRVRVGVGAPTNGDAVNVAQGTVGAFHANEARWRLRVRGGAMSDDAFAIGKVFLDCNRNRLQDGDDEIGVPGVRLLLETGVQVVTDAHGRWSLYGLSPKTHVLKIDAATLPGGAQPLQMDARNMGDAFSRFLDLKKGELARADVGLTGCEQTSVRSEVADRRAAWAERDGRAELDAAVKMGLDTAKLSAEVSTDRRGLPASGSSVGGEPASAGAQDRPLIDLPGNTTLSGLSATVTPQKPATSLPVGAPRTTAPAGSPAVLDPLPAPGSVPLEALVEGLNNHLAFMDLKDGDTLPTRDVNLRVKGPHTGQMVLVVNGVAVSERRIGKRVTVDSAQLAAREYIGVQLKPGDNELLLLLEGPAGAAGQRVMLRVIAPDDLGRLSFELPDDARADPQHPVRIKVHLTDKAGVPVTARTQITLSVERGEWLQTDPNSAEPGLQAMVSGGSAVFELRPPAEPGPVRLQVSSGPIQADADLRLLPARQPLTGVGVIEGVLDFSGRGRVDLGGVPAGAAFEQELAELSGGDHHSARGRAAFYFKGTVRGDVLLTAGYDSDKRVQDRLFRDIKPNEYYPVYGDDSVRGYDAHSSGRLYVRLDRNRSYLLLGDFTTASSPEVRQLSQVNRTLSGVKHKYETDQLRVTSYASRDSLKQQVQEVAATGMSFYVLSGSGEVVPNTERVELVVRSRLQPALVLSATALARGVDYTFEPLTRRLLLANPLASVDADFNPQSLRVTYEVDTGGEQFLVAGVDAQVRVSDSVQLGAVATVDESPENARRLLAVTGLARLTDSTTLRAEAVQTESDLMGRGHAAQAELTHQDGPVRVNAKVQHTGAGFDNPGASASAGRTEANVTGEWTVNADTRVRGEATYSGLEATEGAADGPNRQSVSVAVQHKVNELMAVELGVTRGNVSVSSAGRFDYGQVNGGQGGNGSSSASPGVVGEVQSVVETTVRGRLTTRLPDLPQAEAFVEAEQTVGSSDRHALAVGGSYALTDRTRAYGRHELVSRHDPDTDRVQRVTSVLGIDSAYTAGGRVYNEARWGADNRVTNSTGVRHSLRLGDAWTLSGGVEHTRAIGDAGSAVAGAMGSSTAWTFAADYALDNLRGYGSVEWRDGQDSESQLLSYGLAYRLGADWTLIARGHGTSVDNGVGGSQTLVRQQLGLAWRPTAHNRLDALVKYENRYERRDDPISGSLPSEGTATRSHIMTALANYHPSAGRSLSGRYALRYTESEDEISKSSYWAQLLYGRYTQDLGEHWDWGLQAGLLLGQGGARQHTLGLEVGRQVVPNLWISAGYNVLGLNDGLLTGSDYTSAGFYLRLRFKFDERGLDWLSPRSSESTKTSAVEAPGPGGAAMLAPPAHANSTELPLWAWQPGQELRPVVVLEADTLFGPGADSIALTSQGLQLVDQLAKSLSSSQFTQIDVVAGGGETALNSGNHWLARAAAVRRALLKAGPRDISVAFDSQLPSAKPAPAAGNTTLHLAVLPRWRPVAVASAVSQSGERGVPVTSVER